MDFKDKKEDLIATFNAFGLVSSALDSQVM